MFHSVSGPSVVCGRCVCSHNSLAPSPHARHQSVLWDGIPFLNKDLWQVGQRGSVGHSSMYSSAKLIWQVGQRSGLTAGHSILSTPKKFNDGNAQHTTDWYYYIGDIKAQSEFSFLFWVYLVFTLNCCVKIKVCRLCTCPDQANLSLFPSHYIPHVRYVSTVEALQTSPM